MVDVCTEPTENAGTEDQPMTGRERYLSKMLIQKCMDKTVVKKY